METILHIKAEIPCVYLINGTFVEWADNLRCKENEPVYITVLPLEPVFLPYTVKVIAGKPLSCAALCAVYALGGGNFLVRLKGRFNYVYSTVSRPDSPEPGLVPRFFRLVKEGSYAAARGCMTHELSATVNDEALADFFAEYDDIAENTFTQEGGFLLLKASGEGARFKAELRSGLIDNLEQT